MNKKDILQEAKTKTQVDKAYIDYQKFVKVPKMPVYKFKYIKQQGTTIAEERNENNTYYLIISDKLCTLIINQLQKEYCIMNLLIY